MRLKLVAERKKRDVGSQVSATAMGQAKPKSFPQNNRPGYPQPFIEYPLTYYQKKCPQ